jgi:hypothetical protein
MSVTEKMPKGRAHDENGYRGRTWLGCGILCRRGTGSVYRHHHQPAVRWCSTWALDPQIHSGCFRHHGRHRHTHLGHPAQTKIEKCHEASRRRRCGSCPAVTAIIGMVVLHPVNALVIFCGAIVIGGGHSVPCQEEIA